MTNDLVKTNRGLSPATIAEAQQLAEALAGSAIVPKSYFGKPADVLAAILLGAEVGLSPMTALQSIAVISGRPAVFGDTALALVMASGLLERIHEQFDGNAARCTVKRRGFDEVTRTFSLEDAKRAGLLNKEVWGAYPKRMLQMRARAWALRDAFPDVLRGLAVREELIGMPELQASELPSTAQDNRPVRGVSALEAAIMKSEAEEGNDTQKEDEEPGDGGRTYSFIDADGTEVIFETAREFLTALELGMAEAVRHGHDALVDFARANASTLEEIFAEAEARGVTLPRKVSNMRETIRSLLKE